jgi:hypothetical protein
MHHGSLHQFKNDYRSLTDLPKCGASQKSHARRHFFEAHTEQAMLMQDTRQLGIELHAPVVDALHEIVQVWLRKLQITAAD